MRVRCPGAVAHGTAMLRGWRFVMSRDGYASIVPERGGVVLGVLWGLGVRDLAAINAYENVAGGLYVRRRLPVRSASRCRQTLVYIAARPGEGMPRPGYLAIVVAAARDWALPERYVRSLRRWSPSAWGGARAKDIGDLA